MDRIGLLVLLIRRISGSMRDPTQKNKMGSDRPPHASTQQLQVLPKTYMCTQTYGTYTQPHTHEAIQG